MQLLHPSPERLQPWQDNKPSPLEWPHAPPQLVPQELQFPDATWAIVPALSPADKYEAASTTLYAWPSCENNPFCTADFSWPWACAVFASAAMAMTPHNAQRFQPKLLRVTPQSRWLEKIFMIGPR
jgi:hypothetical protein